MATRKDWSLALAIILATGLGACGKKEEAPPQSPTEVGVVSITANPLRLNTDLPGRTVPYRVADVRPQVSGVILKRLFVEGGEVQAGKPLYQIDPAPYQAALAVAEAALSRAQASAGASRTTAERVKSLIEARAVSKQEVDDANAVVQTAEADVAAARAQVQTARINLGYTKVLSPISGRAGRSMVTEGALVTGNQAATLVTIQQLNPIYVDVTQPSVTLLRLRRQMASGELKLASKGAAAAKLVLEDGTAYGPVGELQFSEVTVEPGTGSVTLRAIFPNPDQVLLPGMFVHATLEEGERESAILVPQQGVTRSARGEPTALVVDKDNKVVLRTLKTERTVDSSWLVSDGLAAGDRVIVEGLQKVRPGDTVAPRDIPIAELGAKPPKPEAAAPAAQQS